MKSAGSAAATRASRGRTRSEAIFMSRQNAARTRSILHVGDRSLVHLVEQSRVLLLDDFALHLEARRQLALVDGEVFRQDRELLDRLVLRKLLVDLVEVRREQLL